MDAAGEPIIGASVLVKGAGTGAVTDIDGKFTVEASVGSTSEVSFIGYRTATVKVTNASTYIVDL
ncbi:MAG: carboxypeptidase-like regulatory domain-containing protein [Bacteroides sp.]|nr:carboxypeptidase-like regulatory domain-containing protein [Bacteroides sp.]